MKQVVCYTIYGCPKCQTVMRYLGERGFEIKEVNVMEQPERADEVINLVGEMITPVLVYETKVVVGDDLKEIEKILPQ